MTNTPETSPEAVERWDIEPDGSAWPHAEGDYVRYEDYAALSAALEAGKDERRTLIQALKDGGEIQRIATARAEAAEAALEEEQRISTMRGNKIEFDLIPALADTEAERDALKAENARLRDALKASREAHCGIADHILERGKYHADGPVDTKGIFADSQRARLGIDAALCALEQGNP